MLYVVFGLGVGVVFFVECIGEGVWVGLEMI